MGGDLHTILERVEAFAGKSVDDVLVLDAHHAHMGVMVEDVDDAVSSGKVMMPSWRTVSAIVPTVQARTHEMEGLLKRALRVVAEHPTPREGIKIVARRALEGWEAALTAPQGEQVNFTDSD